MSKDNFKERTLRGLWYFGMGISLIGLGRIMTISDDRIFKESLSFLLVGSASKIMGVASTIGGISMLTTSERDDTKKDN